LNKKDKLVKIKNINKVLIVIFVAFLLLFSYDSYSMVAPASPCSGATTLNSDADGDWEGSTTWDTGCYPDASDHDVTILTHSISSSDNYDVGDLTVNSGSVLTVSGKTITVYGNLTVDGTIILDGNAYIVMAGSGMTLSGTGIITSSSNNSDFTFSGNTTISSGANLTIGLGAGNEVIIDAGVTITNNGSVTIGSDLSGADATSVWTNATNSILEVGYGLLSTGTLNCSAGGNTVEYYGLAAQNVKDPSSSTYYNLTMSGTNTKTQQSNIIVEGEFIIAGGVFDCNNKDISLKSNFTNTGSFTDGTGTGTYTITFNGTSDQTVSNTTGDIFENITINKSGGTVLLATNVQIANTLTLSSGNIDADSYKVVLGTDISNEGTLSYTSGQVVGQFERYVATTSIQYTFPVGTEDYYRPAKPTFNTITGGGGSIICEFVASSPGSLNPRPTVDGTTNVYNTFVDGYWALTPANGFNTNDYDLELTGTGFTAFTVNSTTRLFLRSNSSSDWTAEGSHVSASGYTAYRTGLSTFSGEYCFADCSTCEPPVTSVISGDSEVCINETGVSYSVTNTTGSSYTWTITGGSVASGQGTNSITVNWGATGRSDANVRVVETNTCTAGDPVDFTISIAPIVPSEILGKTSVPEDELSVGYSVTDLGYTYTWNITGGSVASGQGSSSITVDWGAAGTGNVSVVPTDATCGDGTSIDIDVNKYIIINSAQTGEYSDPDTWDCACEPLETDNIRILNGHTVTLAPSDNPLNVNTVTVDAGGTWNTNGKVVNITGDLTVNGTITTTGTKAINLTGSSITIDGIGGTINTAGPLNFTTGNKTFSSSTLLDITASAINISDAGLTINNYGNVTLNGPLVGGASTSTWTNQASSTLTIDGALLATGTLNASSSGNTVHYNSTSAQNIKTPNSSEYYNLQLSGASTKTQLANLVVSGDITINSGTLDCGNNDLSISGDWNNAGIFTAGTGAVTFDGVSPSITNSSGESYYDLTINLSSGTLSLANVVDVSNILSLSSGNIDVGVNRLTLGISAVSPGTLTYSSGTIIGEFERWVSATSTDYVFPVGTSSNYNPVVLNFNAITNGSVISKFTTGDPGSTGLPVTESSLDITDQYTDGYWTLTAANSMASTDYNISVNGTGFSSYTINSATRLLKRTSGGSWALDGTHQDAASSVAYRNNATGGISTSGTEIGLGQSDCPEFTTSDITGTSDACVSGTETYSVTNVDGNTYNWVVSQGTIDSGQGTNSVTVTWDATASITAGIAVTESSDCYTAPEKSLTVSLHSLESSSISGPESVAEGSTQGPYSVTERSGYTYTWSIPTANGSVASGQGTSAVNITWGSQGGATLRVVGQYGSCTSSANEDLSVTILGTIVSTQTGDWSNSATWVGGTVPGSSDAVKIASGHTVTITSDDQCADLEIVSGATLTQSAGVQHTVTGSYINNGTHNCGSDNLLLTAGASGKSVSGIGTLNNCASLNLGGYDWTIMSGTDLTINNTVAGSVQIASGLTVTNNGTVAISGDLDGGNSLSRWLNSTNSSLNIGGDIMSTGVLTASASGNTVTYNGSTAQTVKGATYNDIVFENSSTKTLGGNITVNGNLTISSGTLDVSGSNYSISLAGNWTNNGSFNAQSGAVVFVGTTQLDASSTQTFYDFVNNGSGVTILADNAITVSNNVTNNSTVTLKSPSSDNPSASWIDNGSISGSGNFSVERYLSQSGRYWYISTPISDGTSAIFDAADVTNHRLYAYDEAASWVQISDNSTSLGVANGYAFKDYNSTELLTHTGSINTGTINKTITYSTSGSMWGYNMISNPYPSAIDWEAAGWTKTNIRNTVYIKKEASWATYNGDSHIGTNGGSRYVASMQTFWIKANGVTGSLQFNNSVRVHDLSTTVKSEIILTDLMRLYIDNGVDTDETVLYFNASGLEAKDSKDTDKSFGATTIPHLYFEETGGEKLAVNTLPDTKLDSDLEVPLGLKVSVAGNYTINVTDLGSFDASKYLYLEDVDLGIIQNLRDNPTYNFSTAGAENRTTRFTIHIKDSPLPVELVSFEGELLDGKVELSWETASEKENDYFEVQKSVDGNRFIEIDYVSGQGNSNELVSYYSVDANPSLGTSYYRLKQVDYDGEFSYSNIISISNYSDIAIDIYPNPATDYIYVQIPSVSELEVSLKIISMDGKVLLENSWRNESGIKRINISDLPSAQYILRKEINNEFLEEAIIIE
jgi:hypothetical protein